jgi:hypothetical protein
MKKQAIPAPQVGDPALREMLVAMKHNLDVVTGQTNNSVKLKVLPSTASTAEIVEQLNAIIRRIQ